MAIAVHFEQAQLAETRDQTAGWNLEKAQWKDRVAHHSEPTGGFGSAAKASVPDEVTSGARQGFARQMFVRWPCL